MSTYKKHTIEIFSEPFYDRFVGNRLRYSFAIDGKNYKYGWYFSEESAISKARYIVDFHEWDQLYV